MEGLEILLRVSPDGSYPVRSHLTHRIGPKTGLGSYPKKETSHHASLKEYGSFIDRGK